MVVSEMGLNTGLVGAYTQNAGQQDTIIRIQLSRADANSASGVRRQAAARLRGRPALRRPAVQLRHRRHGLGGPELRRRRRPSTYRSSAARPSRRLEPAPARSATPWPRRAGRGRRARPPAERRALPGPRRGPREGRQRRTRRPRRGHAGGDGDEFVHRPDAQLLDRPRRAATSTSSPCSTRRIRISGSGTCRTSSRPAPSRTTPVRLSSLVKIEDSQAAGGAEPRRTEARRRTSWSTPRAATSAAWRRHRPRAEATVRQCPRGCSVDAQGASTPG